jgi:hypothetical protein
VTLNKTYRAEIINTPNIPHENLTQRVGQLLIRIEDHPDIKDYLGDGVELDTEYTPLEIRESCLHFLERAEIICFHGTCKEFPEHYVSRFNLLKQPI